MPRKAISHYRRGRWPRTRTTCHLCGKVTALRTYNFQPTDIFYFHLCPHGLNCLAGLRPPFPDTPRFGYPGCEACVTLWRMRGSPIYPQGVYGDQLYRWQGGVDLGDFWS